MARFSDVQFQATGKIDLLKGTKYMGATRGAAATTLGSKSANPSRCQAVISMPIGAAVSHISSTSRLLHRYLPKHYASGAAGSMPCRPEC